MNDEGTYEQHAVVNVVRQRSEDRGLLSTEPNGAGLGVVLNANFVLPAALRRC